MAGRAKKSRKDSDSDVFIADDQEPGFVTRWLLRPALLLLLLAGVGTFFIGPQVWNWLPDLSRRPEYRVRADEIHFTAPPAWIPKTFLRQVIRGGNLADELSLLDDRVVDEVAAAFQKHPWVERVVSVRKDLANRLTATIEYREPVATVILEGDRFLIDGKAVLLPPFDGGEADELPRIKNAHSAPKGPAGTVWEDPAVQGGARLAAVLRPSWKKLELESIVIPEVDGGESAAGECVYILLAAGGSRIIWGRAPGTENPAELSPDQKVGRLEDYHLRHRGFSGANGPIEMDIRHWQQMDRRPLSQRPGRPQS